MSHSKAIPVPSLSDTVPAGPEPTSGTDSSGLERDSGTASGLAEIGFLDQTLLCSVAAVRAEWAGFVVYRSSPMFHASVRHVEHWWPGGAGGLIVPVTGLQTDDAMLSDHAATRLAASLSSSRLPDVPAEK